MGMAVTVATLYDRTLIFLCLPPVLLLSAGFLWRRRLARPVIRRFRGARQRQRRLAAAVRDARGDADGALARFATTVRWMAGLEFPPVQDAERPTDYGRGGVFRTIQVPFLLWVYSRRRWAKLALGWGAVLTLLVLGAGVTFVWTVGPSGHAASGATALVPAALSHGAGLEWYAGWLGDLVKRFDAHLAASLIVMIWCGAQSPAAGLAGFLELTWLLGTALVVVLVAALGADAFDAAVVLTLGKEHLASALMLDLGPRPVMTWFEPAILSLGVAGVYNLMKVLDTRFADKT
jgi:hypothetical protein